MYCLSQPLLNIVLSLIISIEFFLVFTKYIIEKLIANSLIVGFEWI